MLNMNTKEWLIENGVLVEYRGVNRDITVPEGVTTIGMNAFISLKKNDGSFKPITIKLPTSLRVIATKAFSKILLEEIDLKEGIEEIGNRAFEYTYLKTITLPRSINKVGSSIFERCINLTELCIADNLELIPVFRDTIDLNIETLIIDNSENLLEFISRLKEEKITSVKRLYLRQFPIESRIQREIYKMFPDIEILSHLDNWEIFNAQQNSKNDFWEIEDGYLTYLRITNNEHLVVPSANILAPEVITYEDLGLVELPNSLLEIGSKNFSYTSIKKIVLPPNLRRLGNYLFTDSDLEELRIPPSVCEMEAECLQASGIKRLIITDYLARVATDISNALPDSLEELVIENYKGDVVPLIKKLGLKNHPGLKLIIDKNAIDRDEYEELVKILGSEITIENGPYENSEKPAIDSDDFVIENGVLTKYTGLSTNIVILEGVKEIAPRAFASSRLESVVLPITLEIIGDEAFSDNIIRSITFPKSLRRIGERAFNQNLISSISLPPNLNHVGSGAFFENQIEKISLYDTQNNLEKLKSSVNPIDINQVCIYNLQNRALSTLEELGFSNVTAITVMGIPISLKERIDLNKLLGHLLKIKHIKLQDWEMDIEPNLEKSEDADELESVLGKLRKVLEEINPEDRKTVENQINSIVDGYKKAFSASAPKLNFDREISLSAPPDPITLKRKVIAQLNRILAFLNEQKPLYIFANEVEYYKTLINARIKEKPTATLDDVGKIEYIMAISTTFNIGSTKEALTKLIMKTDDEITDFLKSPENTSDLMIENLKLGFKLELEKIRLDAERYEMLQQSLSGIGDSDLACDIRALNEILECLDNENRRLFKMELSNLQNKFKRRVVTDTLKEIIIDFRKELDSLLKKLKEIALKIDGKQGALDEISATLGYLENGAFSSPNLFINIIEEIKKLMQDNAFSEELQDEVTSQIKNCLLKWESLLRNRNLPNEQDSFRPYFYQEALYNSTLDLESICKIKIGAELYDIKDVVEKYIKKETDHTENNILGI